MKRPNFFVVGAPKCGTTALCQYLQSHPRIFFSAGKELNYFNTDFSETFRRHARSGLCRSEEEYLSHFRGADDSHLVAGEGTTLYLVSEMAIANIHRFDPHAKIIVMLRNPVDMAQSFHGEVLFNSEENVRDFEEAWELQTARCEGSAVPPNCTEPKLLQYRHICSLGSQMQRLLRVFPRRQVLAILFDDFVADTRGAYEETLAFLGVPSDGRTSFPPVNVRKEHRLKFLNELLLTSRAPVFLKVLAYRAKRVLRLRSLGIGPLLMKYNTARLKKPSLRPEFRQVLVEAFGDDVELLEEVLGRKLNQ